MIPKNTEQNRAKAAIMVKSWRYWGKGALYASVGGFANAGLVFLNNLTAGGAGINTGDLISWGGFFLNSGIGALIGLLTVAKKFSEEFEV